MSKSDLSDNPYTGGIARFVAGLGHDAIPSEVLGRTQSIVTFASYAVLPAGALLTGVLLQYAGPRGTVLTFGGILAAVAIYSSVSRDLRAPAAGC